jgi:hypothetical protein
VATSGGVEERSDNAMNKAHQGSLSGALAWAKLDDSSSYSIRAIVDTWAVLGR